MIIVQRGESVSASSRASSSSSIGASVPLCPQEAAELSSLKSQLQDLEVPLFAVVKENLGKELDCFKKYFTGKVYVDQKVG